jgi:hypothetical protein
MPPNPSRATQYTKKAACWGINVNKGRHLGGRYSYYGQGDPKFLRTNFLLNTSTLRPGFASLFRHKQVCPSCERARHEVLEVFLLDVFNHLAFTVVQ